MSDESIPEVVQWNEPLEEYFRVTGDRCDGYAWLHRYDQRLYGWAKGLTDLPIMIGSGLIGLLSAGGDTLLTNTRNNSVGLAFASFGVGTLKALESYYAFGQRAESHKNTSNSYSQLHDFIKIEMNLDIKDRMSPHDLLKIVRERYERLKETQPEISRWAIAKFRTLFLKRYTTMAFPPETNGLEAIVIHHRNSVYKRSEGSPSTLRTPLLQKAGSQGSVDGKPKRPRSERMVGSEDRRERVGSVQFVPPLVLNVGETVNASN